MWWQTSVVQIIPFVLLFLAAFRYTEAGNGCPNGWISRKDACYFYNTAMKTWQGARTACQSYGADLVVIKDAEENQFIASMRNNNPAWLGLSDQKEEGTWVWVDGTKLTSAVSQWNAGEPNDAGSEDCASFNGGNNKWNDLPCSRVLTSLCKLEVKRRKPNCTSDYMEISLARDNYNISKYESMNLLDSTCKASVSSTYITLGTQTTSCGTTKIENQTHIIYTNQVILKVKAASTDALVTRDHDEVISFSCAYAKDGYASGASFVPVRKLVANETNFGSFTFELGMFKSNSYSKSYSNYPVPLKIKDNAYFQVQVNANDADLILLINQCYSTPSMDKNDNRKYTFIDNRCPSDNTVKFYAADHKRQRFSVETFRYLKNYTAIYIHCLVFLCQKTSSDARCKSGCSGNTVNRVKRDVSRQSTTENAPKSYSQYYMLEAGPIVFVGSKESTGKQGKTNTQSGVSTSVIVLVVGVVVLAVLLLAAVVRMRRMRNARYQVAEEIGIYNAPNGKAYLINDDDADGKSNETVI